MQVNHHAVLQAHYPRTHRYISTSLIQRSSSNNNNARFLFSVRRKQQMFSKSAERILIGAASRVCKFFDCPSFQRVQRG